MNKVLMNKKSMVERICEGEEKRKTELLRSIIYMDHLYMNKEKRLINLRTFNGNTIFYANICWCILLLKSVWMYYFVKLTIHSSNRTESEFSSEKYLRHLSNMSTICQIFVNSLSNMKIFVKYVKYLSNM